MASPRSQRRIALSKPDGGQTSPIQILTVGMASILFLHGVPWAVRGETEAYYPDSPVAKSETPGAQELLTSSKVRAINDFAKDRSLLRVPTNEFDYIVASSLMPQLRPLLRLDPPDAGQFPPTKGQFSLTKGPEL